jgi:uncharacterized protein (TIGR00251 family)
MPTALKATSNGILLSVKLQPRSSRNEIGECVDGELKIRVTAPPVDSAANNALVAFLAEILGRPKSAIQLIRGQTSRHKVLLIAGMTATEATARLQKTAE